MAKYLFSYHGGRMADTEEAQQAAMAAWGAWFGELGSAVVDPGNPIARSRTVGEGNGANPVTGYSLVEADSLDDAAAKAQSCPVLANGGSVEIGEAIEIAM
jgi:hypothetical protein